MKKFLPIIIGLLVFTNLHVVFAEVISSANSQLDLLSTQICGTHGDFERFESIAVKSDGLDESLFISSLKKLERFSVNNSNITNTMLAPTEVRWPAGAMQGPTIIGCNSGGSLAVNVEVFLAGITDADPTAPGNNIECVIHLGRVTAFGSGPCDVTPAFECIRNIPMTYAGADNGAFDVFTGLIENLPPGNYEYTCACSDNGTIVDPLTHPAGNILWIGGQPCPAVNPFVNGRISVNEPALDDNCTGTLTALNNGANLVDNLCTTDGRAFFTYTVTNGETFNIVPSNGSLVGPQIYTVRLNNCAASPVTLPLTCIPPGTVVYIEAGLDDTPGPGVCPGYGDFTLTITDMDNGVVNDVCADATALNNFGGNNVLGCGETGGFTGNPAACPDPQANCFGAATNGVWYRFTTSAAIESFSITTTGGGVYELFQGNSCAALTSLGCSITNLTSNSATTYYLLVGPNGTVTVTSDQNIPANDECSNATTLTGAGLTNQTNVCADDELISGCTSQDDNVVWYQFTMPAGQENATITISPVGPNPIANPAIAVFSGACGGLTLIDSECSNSIVLTCLIPGTTYRVAVGSAAGDSGNFNLSLNTSDNGVANDACADATPITNTETCQYFNVTANTTGACPESFTSNCNGGNNAADATVWRSFTVPAGVNSINIRNVTPAGAYLQIIGTCGSTMTIPGGFCINGAGPTANIAVTPGTTYFIAVAIAGGSGAVNFEMRYNQPPANDLCADAITLAENTTTQGTNACATAFSTAYCGLNTTTSHTVFYRYIVPASNIKSTKLEITVNGSTSTTGTAATAIALGFFQNCSGTLAPVSIESGNPCTALGNTVILECVAPGTEIIIAVGSADGSEGDFSINVNENDAMIPDNDLCTNPVIININQACEFQTVNGTNVNACPETINGGTCSLNNRPTVWYQITLPANAIGLGFEDLTGGVNLAIFNNNCNAPGYAPTQVGNCITGNEIITTGLMGGNTYLIAATSATEGPFSFDIKTIVPPANDLCTNATPLTSGNAVDGTTSCATPEAPPFNAPSCPPADQTNTVFYSFTIPNGNRGMNITINSSGANPASGNINIAVFDSGSPACNINGGTLEDDDCISLGETSDIFTCLGPGTYVIRVATSDNNAGSFSIRVDLLPEVQPNDRCLNATQIPNSPTCEFFTVQTTSTVDACPEEFTVGGCALNFTQQAVVWYSFTTPPGTVSIEIEDIVAGGFLVVLDGCPPPLPTVVGTGCYSGAGTNGTPIPVSPNTTYYVAIGLNNGNQGNVFFDLKYNLELPNDNPCVGGFVPVVLSSGSTLANQDNTCATQDDQMCSNNSIIKTVWYQFTVTAPNNRVTVNITGTGTDPLSNPAIAIFDNIGAGTPNVPCTNNPINSECSGSGTAVFNCLNPGTYLIQIGTTEANAGQFSINVEQSVGDAVPNDLCTNAEVITIDVLCSPIQLTGTNIDACPENLPAGSFNNPCNFNAEETSWYIFTAPGDPGDQPTLSFRFTSYSGSGTPFMGIFNVGANCNNLTSVNPTCFQGLNNQFSNIGPLVPGNQYFIAISSFGDTGGDFEFEVVINLGPPNDDPCASVISTDYLLQNGVTANGTTLCAAPDPFFPDCQQVHQQNVVFYEVNVPDGIRGIAITVNASNANGTPIPNGSTVVVGILPNACNPTTYVSAACLSLGQTQNFLCLEPGVYNIQVSTSTANEGDFTIRMTHLEYTTTCENTLNNDECETPFDLNPVIGTTYCEPIRINGCNNEACPESFNFGANCPFATMPVVWYTFTTASGVASVDILGLTGTGGGTPFLAIFDNITDCDALPTAISQCILNQQTNIAVQENTTYYLAVGVNSPSMNGGGFRFDIVLNRPPENDDPNVNSDRPPFDLTGGGSHQGNTCCAVGFNDNPNLDFPNVRCGAATNDNSVWYVFQVTGEDAIEIRVNGAGITGNTTVEVYPGTATAPALQLFGPDASSCGALPATIRLGCLTEGEWIWIKVGSRNQDCGEFNISIMQAEKCRYADTCEDITGAQTLDAAPTDVNCGNFEIRSISGCLDLACPEENIGDCEFNQNPTVWFQINVDQNAVQLFTFVSTSGSWTPVWAIYSGPCDQLMLLPGGTIENPAVCSNEGNPESHNIGIPLGPDGFPISPLYVAVSGQGVIDDPNFTLSAFTQAGCVSCIGNDACSPEATFAIIDRDSDRPLDDPLFCQGETVRVCIDFFYDPSETGVDWFHGFIPNFGPGWDLEAFDASTATTSPGGAQWYTMEDGDCAPYITERMPLLCAYTDANGVYRLCNIKCGSCPCTPPLEAGTPLPNGWFWNSNGGAGCANNCNPASRYGLPGSNTGRAIQVCMTIKTKEFDTPEECTANRSLRLSFVTTSDGVSGCWNDPIAECKLDVAQVGPNWLIDCTEPVRVDFDDVELCNEGTLNSPFATQDGTSTPIFIEPIPNGSVSGMNSYSFPTGFGTVTDRLTNLSNSVQIAQYIVWAQRPTDLCPGPRDTFNVTLYPQLEVNFAPIYVCYGESAELIPIITGGTGNYIGWQWSTGATTPTITVGPLVSTTYFVTVTDDLGCTGTGEVELEVKNPVTFNIEPNPIEMCRDGISQPVTVSAVNIVANGAFAVFWEIPVGLGGQPISGTSDIIIFEEDSQPGEYELCATVLDQFGCSETECVTVTIILSEPPTLIALPITCGATTATLQAFFLGDAELLLFDCDDNLVQTIQATSFHQFDPVNLQESTCYRLLVISGSGGCPASAQINIPLIVGDQVTIGGDILVCEGSPSSISVTNPGLFTGFTWNTGATGPTITPIPTPPSEIFRVTATQANGCTSVAQIEVTTQPAPVISLSGSFSFCVGGSSTITASAVPSAGTTFEWFDNMGMQIGTSNTIILDQPGDYTVVATSAIGCSIAESFTIEEDDELSPSLNNVTLCDNSPDTLNAGTGFASYAWSFDGMDLSDDTQRIEISQGGIYCVTVSDASGCTGATCRTVVNNVTPQITVTDTIEVCRQETGQGPTFINFNNQVSGAAGTWTDLGGTGVDLTNLNNVSFLDVPTGFYSFRYRTNTAVAPCVNVEEIMVVRVRTCPCPTVALLPIPDLCNDNGSVNLNNFRANAMQTGTWTVISGPEPVTLTGTTFNATGLTPGVYTVQFEIAPVGTCPTTATRTINVFEAPRAAKTGDAILCNATGGTGPVSIDLSTLLTPNTNPGGVWTQVSGDPIASALPLVNVDGMNPQTLVFRYTTANAMAPCTNASVNINVTVRDCNCPLVVIAPLPDICNGSNDIIDFNDYLTTDPVGLAGTWSISPSGTIINGSQLNPFGMTSGPYVVTFTITGTLQPQCQRTFTADLRIRRQPAAVARTGDSPCNLNTGNGPTVIDLDTWIVQSPAPSAGVWVQTGGPTTLTIQAGNLVDFAGTNAGAIYTFEYRTNVANPPCFDIAIPVTIVVLDCDCPNVATTPPAAVCNSGGTLDLATLETANIGPGSWTVVGPGGNTITLNGKLLDYTGLPAGNYTLTYTLTTDPGGTCPRSTQQTLRVENQNSAVVQATVSVCNVDKGAGEQFLNFNNFVLDGDKSGTWTNTSGAPVSLANLDAVDFSNTVIGQTYTFTYTINSTAPCENRSYTILVTVLDCTCTPVRPEMIPIQCTGTGVLNLAQFNDPNRPGNWSSTQVTIVNNTVDMSGLATGSYVLTFRVSNPEPDCPDSQDVTLTVLRQVSSGTATGSYTYCAGTGTTVDLNTLISGQDPGGRWREVSGQPSQPGSFNPNTGVFNGALNNAIGTFQFEYFFDNQSPCQDVATRVSVIVNGLPTVDVGPSRILDCVTTSTTIGGPNTETGANITYQWTHDGGRTVPNANQRTTTVDFSGLFTLVVTNTSTGCSNSATVQVDIDPNRPQAEVSKSDVTCFGANDGRITFINVTGGQAPLRYSINGGASFQGSPDFGNLAPGNYILLIRDNTGCEFNSSITITQPALFTIDLGPDVGIQLGESTTLTLANSINPANVSSIEWTSRPIGGQTSVICSQPTSNCISVSVSPDNTTTYCATVTDINGCVATDCVNVIPEKVRNVIFPNIIRPDNPQVGINRTFAVFGNDINRILRVSIYDRWGELVYTTEDFPANTHGVGWDGRFKGTSVVPGVYVYLVEVEFNPRVGSTEFEREIFTGDVTVAR